jgi:hypothetical protein
VPGDRGNRMSIDGGEGVGAETVLGIRIGTERITKSHDDFLTGLGCNDSV